jgi:hypothetical protein
LSKFAEVSAAAGAEDGQEDEVKAMEGAEDEEEEEFRV